MEKYYLRWKNKNTGEEDGGKKPFAKTREMADYGVKHLNEQYYNLIHYWWEITPYEGK